MRRKLGLEEEETERDKEDPLLGPCAIGAGHCDAENGAVRGESLAAG